MNQREKAEALRDQVLKTWDPPLHMTAAPADVAQTSAMQVLAWCFGKEFLGELTPSQEAAIDQGLELYEQHFGV